VLAVIVITTIFVLSRRNSVDSENAVGPPVQGASEVAASGRAVRIKKVKPLKKPRDPKKESA
jgi:PiT family inorganic phosphate transporter